MPSGERCKYVLLAEGVHELVYLDTKAATVNELIAHVERIFAAAFPNEVVRLLLNGSEIAERGQETLEDLIPAMQTLAEHYHGQRKMRIAALLYSWEDRSGISTSEPETGALGDSMILLCYFLAQHGTVETFITRERAINWLLQEK
jgi:hypothetical protein